MIKAIIFDLDGVLVDTKKIHYNSLNKALRKYKHNIISPSAHVEIFDGLPTNEKLKILNNKNLIPKKDNSKIKKYKQAITQKILKKSIKKKKKLIKIFEYLKKNNFKIAIATNAVKSTLKICLKKLNIDKFIDYSLSNEEIINPKPNPEIYLRIFIKFGIYPKEAIIVEDSYYGREAAISSGAKLLPLKSTNDLNLEIIKKLINSNKSKKKNVSWEDNKMNILIPMAGAGKRFVDAGYIFPKPLIEIKNKPMIQWVIESLNINANYIFIIQKSHQQKYNIKSVLQILKPGCKIIELEGVTEGAACTTLLAKKYINNSNPLMIANSDQFIKWDSSKALYDFETKDLDGAILTFKAVHPKWSYAKCDEQGYVVEVAEKKVISTNATVGVYYWKHGSDFVSSAETMIKKNIRVNNEFYVCPVYNEYLKKNKKIKIYEIEEMWGMGTPQDLQNFLQNFKF
jgi:HAD superfamily hydrolase (TIGR01509 family)